MKINWFTKLLIKLWPTLTMKYMARKMSIKNPIFNQVHHAFFRVKRIDLIPFSPNQLGQRGFMIILDRKTALYFYQDDDHFIYDGYEMGEYDKGNVTIFDNLIQ